MTAAAALDHSWFRHAACRGLNPNLFYVDPGNNRGHNQAKQVCVTCPVRRPCLEAALATPLTQDFGVWGGKSEDERKTIRRRRARARQAFARLTQHQAG